MATTEHGKSTDPMDAVDVRLTEVNYGVAYGLVISFRDGKRFGVFLPKDATQEEIVRRLRVFADSIDVGSVIEEPKAPTANRIESLVPGPGPVFIAGNNEFGVITIRAREGSKAIIERAEMPSAESIQDEVKGQDEISSAVAWLIAPVQKIVDSIIPIFVFMDGNFFYRIFADGRVEKHEIEPTEGVPSDGIHPAINNIGASLLQLISTISDQVEAARKP